MAELLKPAAACMPACSCRDASKARDNCVASSTIASSCARSSSRHGAPLFPKAHFASQIYARQEPQPGVSSFDRSDHQQEQKLKARLKGQVSVESSVSNCHPLMYNWNQTGDPCAWQNERYLEATLCAAVILLIALPPSDEFPGCGSHDPAVSLSQFS